MPHHQLFLVERYKGKLILESKNQATVESTSSCFLVLLVVETTDATHITF